MGTKFNERMEDFFDIKTEESENLPQIIEEPNKIFFGELDDDLKNDYETSRENLNELIEKGKSAFDDILTIARETEKGRDFEVAATMLKTVLEANEKMLDIHKKIREISNYKQKEETKTNIKNAIFVGSTKELAKMVKDINEKDVIEGN
jgi:DNA-binding ferritin-like protein